MIATLNDLARIMEAIGTPLGSFRIGEDTPSMVGYSPIPKWDMMGKEQPPEYKGPFWLQFVLKAPDYAREVTSKDLCQCCQTGAACIHSKFCRGNGVPLPQGNSSAEWRGRKWRISRYSTGREVVGTAFMAVMAAMEHETREGFTWQGRAVFGPHIPLVDLAFAAEAEPDARG